MPPSSKLLLKILEYEGSMTQKELAKKSLLPERTVRLAIRHLLGKGYIRNCTMCKLWPNCPQR